MAEIQEEVNYLNNLRNEYSGMNPHEGAYLRALASIFHDFYSGLERIFQKIARSIDGGVPEGKEWHRDLLHQMALEIPELRPGSISGETEAALIEFLKFRHLFRNQYGFLLKQQNLIELKNKFEPVYKMAIADIQRMVTWLDRVRKQ